MSRSEKRKRPRALKPGMYRFEPAEVPSCPLELRNGKGLSIVKSIGLEHFLLHAEMPKMNEQLCTAFISSYSPKAGYGVVNGLQTGITAEAVAEVMGLPMGMSNCPEAQRILLKDELLHRFVPSAAKRCWHGYDLEQLKYAGDGGPVDENTVILVAIGRRLMQKMLCRTRFLQYANAGVLVGIDTAMRNRIQMAWAEFMARAMRKAVAHVKRASTRKAIFGFGEWLTGLLEHALARGKHLPPPSSACNGERMILASIKGYQHELLPQLVSSSPSLTQQGAVIDQQDVVVFMCNEMERMKEEMRKVLNGLESHRLSLKRKIEERRREMQGLITELTVERNARKETEARMEQVEEYQVEVEEMIEDLARRRDDLELENTRLKEELELREEFMQRGIVVQYQTYKRLFDQFVLSRQKLKQWQQG